ncbi:MAG: TolC family protein, partial [Bacteroidota bacterium]
TSSFKYFLLIKSKTNYPPRQEINNNILALERQLKGNKRAYYTPTVGLGFNQQEIFERGGSASTETPNSNFINSTWSIGLNVSYPVFDGNRRHINLQKTLVQQDQLNLSLKQFDNDLAFNIKSATVDLVTSRTNINYSQISSESSWKNFQIMQDYYRQGRVSVVQLFDAQNSALETKLAYNNSVYNFLVAFVTLENNVGFYSMLASQEAKDEYELRYQNFKANQDN